MRLKVNVLLSSGEVLQVWSFDLSLGGMQLLSEYSADAGDTLPVFFNVLDPQTDEYVRISGKMRIVHVVYDGSERCFRIGVEFVSFEGEGKEIYRRFLDGRIYSRFGQHLLTR